MEGASLERKHGSLGSKDWADPVCVVEFNADARPGIAKAHEFNDTPEVLREKVTLLAKLVRDSQNCLIFTGAGISTAAGIADYATKAKEDPDYQWTETGAQLLQEFPSDHTLFKDVQDLFGRPKVGDEVTSAMKSRLKRDGKWTAATAHGAVRLKVFNWMDAQPTQAHRVLTAMYDDDLFQNWIQQNHDSLPQKAGYPQHALNEIHGSLHDPGNPVIEINGFLRSDLSKWLAEWSGKNDLCLALGTSLSGFNVDSVPQEAAERARAGKGLGLVMVNLQQTQYDEITQLRIFAKLDHLMTLLAEELGIAGKVKPMDHKYQPMCAEGSAVEEDVFMVPFDNNGHPSSTRTVWDLRQGKLVKITGGPYEGNIGTIVEKSKAGHYRISCKNFNIAQNAFADSNLPPHLAKKKDFSMWLGNWWLEEATKGFGILPGGMIPIVSVAEEPEEDKEPAPELVAEAPVRRPSNAIARAPPPPPALGKDGKGKGKGKFADKQQQRRDACYCQ